MPRSWLLAGLLCLGLNSAWGHETQRGEASYYGAGEKLNKITACRELFSPWKIAAAHRTLPCGSYAQVINLANHRSIIVKINDWGPAEDTDRIIDVTREVARRLGFVDQGVAEVLVVPVR